MAVASRDMLSRSAIRASGANRIRITRHQLPPGRDPSARMVGEVRDHPCLRALCSADMHRRSTSRVGASAIRSWHPRPPPKWLSMLLSGPRRRGAGPAIETREPCCVRPLGEDLLQRTLDDGRNRATEEVAVVACRPPRCDPNTRPGTFHAALFAKPAAQKRCPMMGSALVLSRPLAAR
jgi:hypothetical protein